MDALVSKLYRFDGYYRQSYKPSQIQTCFGVKLYKKFNKYKFTSYNNKMKLRKIKYCVYNYQTNYCFLRTSWD